MNKIKSFLETSFLDWDGKISSVIFLCGCNLRCIYCHNYKLVLYPHELQDISWDKIINYLLSHRKWIDGVCITGGEPCLYNNLENLIREIKNNKLLVKLDTNGFFPEILIKLIGLKLIDFVAMDIKAPLENKIYMRITGKEDIDIDKIKKSIMILQNSSIEYEFRTTVVPDIVGKEEVKNIAKMLDKNDKYVLQNFNPINALSEELRKVKPYTKDEMILFQENCKNFVNNCIIR
ncbi:MAG: anaerobic ribonucleoside-triphosphate reductase activating protein [Candidatus Firestonebacteria bacterium]|nr:anaerobic ribonucleoside-triphosphate reductase activating protein [Candidatus Firestonebacteria bacterium]